MEENKESTDVQEGQRVAAFESFKDGVVRFLGYGKYVGDVVPDENASGWAQAMRENDVPNPCIELESGEKVYGAECWWGPAEKIDHLIEAQNAKVEQVSVKEMRESTQ